MNDKESALDAKEYENNSQSNIVVTGQQDAVLNGSVASDSSLVESVSDLTWYFMQKFFFDSEYTNEN